jgi:hypothetical protein
MAPAARFISSGGNGRGNYLMCLNFFQFFFYVFKEVLARNNNGCSNEDLFRNSNDKTEGTDPGVCIGAYSGRTSGGQGCIQLFCY